ncbi:DUF4124 domain-containing protein [Pseudorhodoferax soli]|uniref:Uncharacterized protein DUF4124 n=1 Tax=Pseudorhodoferax soli TaxID=545864 RepID=A0A368XUL2_9BURK|nr:DUF4124 domain-containing protein [Pseudorhodoferax soli]RCW71565.1 uncharacterized protein DUF4124 [Pseudorhodoferax soli]
MTRAGARMGLGLLGAGWAMLVQAQGIYTCVDGQGRHITSDRPIKECIDRAQKELNPSGSLRREVGPSLTASERAQIEARERRAAEEQARNNEEIRRSRAMLSRYRDQAAHDRARAEALAPVDGVLALAQQRMQALDKQRQLLDRELEFYPNTPPEKLPPKLRSLLDEHKASVAAQQRVIAEQDAERKRVNDRYDEELARLRQLWTEQTLPGRPR